MNNLKNEKRVEIQVFGIVQGVFFRANTRDYAKKLGVKGTVRNCYYGSVEIVAEGKEEELNELIAFARVVGDGGLCFYIQEIIVHPNHRRKGIATKFMDHIFIYLRKTATKRSYIGVFSGKGLERFYEKYGFWKRPTSEMGYGMMLFWKDNAFNKYYGSSTHTSPL